MVTMYQGDCREILRELPDESVHCCVTSPPYWSLRDYGTARWEGGNPECGHWIKGDGTSAGAKQSTNAGSLRVAKDVCPSCGAKRIDAQIGLEKTPEEYVAQMVAVFREVKRVLRKDGTLWLNLGDSYGRAPEKGGSGTFNGRNGNGDGYAEAQHLRSESSGSSDGKVGRGERAAVRNGSVKPKDLCGIPWLVAFALRADGWYLRQDIIWAKPNPMPESVTDRCTKAHEYIFLLSKSATYFYDQEAIKEAAAWERWGDQTVIKEQQGTASWIGNKSKAELTGRGGKNAFRGQGANRDNENGHANRDGRDMQDIGTDLTRNKRSVWEVATSPFPEAHFATFPPELIKPCILAGCPSNGTVLDPFFGAGTTGLVSGALNCHCIGIELNQEYLEIAAKRLSQSVFQFSPESETSPELQQSLLGPDEEKKRNL